MNWTLTDATLRVGDTTVKLKGTPIKLKQGDRIIVTNGDTVQVLEAQPMKVTRTERGFEKIERVVYADDDATMARLVQASSAIGDYEDAFENPGSSYLWIGPVAHLNREEVAELIQHLQSWVSTGSLEIATTTRLTGYSTDEEK